MSSGKKYLSKKCGRFYGLFVDFSKPFDWIDHKVLINSLIKKGVHDFFFFFKLLIAMYIEDLARVVISYEIYETSLRRVS